MNYMEKLFTKTFDLIHDLRIDLDQLDEAENLVSQLDSLESTVAEIHKYHDGVVSDMHREIKEAERA